MKTSQSARYSGRPLSDYDLAIARAARWLKSQQRMDGSSGDNLPLWAYYTQPMAFRAVGEPRYAARTLSFIKREFLKEDGRLEQDRGAVEGIVYAPSWTTVSSHMWDRFDISYPVSNWILQFQDQRAGGFFTTREEARKGKGVLEFDATLVGGLALLSTGKLAQAEKVGKFLFTLHKAQPDMKNRYYFMWDTEKGVMTDYDTKLAIFYEMDKRRERQGYFQFGLTIGFLSRLYMATGTKGYLNLARDHFDFVTTSEGVYSAALSHKLCWACANLYAATGETRFLEAAKKVGDHLIGVQKEDGRYHYREIVPNFEDQDQTTNLDIVSQFTTWIAAARAFLVDR